MIPLPSHPLMRVAPVPRPTPITRTDALCAALAFALIFGTATLTSWAFFTVLSKIFQ